LVYTFIVNYKDFIRSYAVFKKLPEFNKDRDGKFLRAYSSLAPSECFGEKRGRLTSFLKKNDGLHPRVVKALKVRNQESGRCRKIKELAKKEG